MTMPLKDRVCFKRGVLTAAIFAIAGFLLAFAGLCFAEPFRSFFTLPRLPGWYALRLCATPMEIGHGYAFFLPVTNAVVYAVIGFIIGLFSGSQRNATRFGSGMAIIIVLSMLAVPVTRYVNSVQRTALQKSEYEQRLREQPDDAKSLHWLGVHHFSRTGDLRQAEEYFRKLVELEHNQIPPLYRQRSLLYLAMIYQREGRHEKAEEMYMLFVDTHPDLDNDLVLLNYSRQYMKQKPAWSNTPNKP